MDTSKGTEKIKDEGAVETKVETVDYRTAPGLDKEPEKEPTVVTHLTRPEDEKPPGAAGYAAEAAAKVAESFQSAKEVIAESVGSKKTE